MKLITQFFLEGESPTLRQDQGHLMFDTRKKYKIWHYGLYRSPGNKFPS